MHFLILIIATPCLGGSLIHAQGWCVSLKWWLMHSVILKENLRHSLPVSLPMKKQRSSGKILALQHVSLHMRSHPPTCVTMLFLPHEQAHSNNLNSREVLSNWKMEKQSFTENVTNWKYSKSPQRHQMWETLKFHIAHKTRMWLSPVESCSCFSVSRDMFPIPIQLLHI